MADGLKPLGTPMQCSDELSDDVELQACRLFEEFLLLPEPVSSPGFLSAEVADCAGSPAYWDDGRESYKPNRGAFEACESFEDDEVTDSPVHHDVISKSAKAQGVVEQKSPISPAGSQDQNLKDLAIKMRTAGDKLVQDYRYMERASGIESTLLNVISRSAADLTYDTFSKEVDKLIGRDRSWTNMVLTFYVGKRVVTRAKEVKNYFEQYIRSYNPVLQQAGGLEPFVNSHV